MVALARKTVLYEWRRFVAAMLAVAFSGVLMLMQLALVLGIFGSASVYVRATDADIWAGYPGTQSVDLGQPIPPIAQVSLLMDPDVLRAEPFRWLDSEWRSAHGNVSVHVCGIDPQPDGLMFSRALAPELRRALLQPDGVIVDRADLDTLGVVGNDLASIDGHRVRVVGVASGLRALGGVNVLTSLATARYLDTAARHADWPTYYVAKLRPGADPAVVRSRLQPSGKPLFSIWIASQWARRAELYWLFETGAGLGVAFLAVVALGAGVVITSQTLSGAVAGSIPLYATLQALGVGRPALRRVVLEQAAWVGGCGLVVGAVIGWGLIAFGRRHDVPLALNVPVVIACALLVLAVTCLSGLWATRVLRQADPALLLR